MSWKPSLNVVALTFFTAFTVICTAYYWWLNAKPFTQNAFVVTDTQTVSPWVDGYIEAMYIKDGQFVKKGEPLIKTFSPPYELKVAELKSAIRKVAAKMEKVHHQLRVVESEIKRDEAAYLNQTYLARQALQMYTSDAISQTYTEEKVRASQMAEAQLKATRGTVMVLNAELKVLAAETEELGAQLALAEIYNSQTVIRALHDGYISNMFATTGTYHRAGEKLFAVIPNKNWRIQANFEETDLSLIKPGQRARIWLWQYPGKTFHGIVETVNYAIDRQKTSTRNAMQIIEPENQWFLLPRRFPVQIRLLDPSDEYPLTLGASAYVQIDVSSQLLKQIIWRIYRW